MTTFPQLAAQYHPLDSYHVHVVMLRLFVTPLLTDSWVCKPIKSGNTNGILC